MRGSCEGRKEQNLCSFLCKGKGDFAVEVSSCVLLLSALSAATLGSDAVLRVGCVHLSRVSATARNAMIGLHSQGHCESAETSVGACPAEAQQGASIPSSMTAIHLQSPFNVEQDLGHAPPARAGDGVASSMKASLGSDTVFVQGAEKRDREQAKGEDQVHSSKAGRPGWRKCANCKQQHHWNSKCQPLR